MPSGLVGERSRIRELPAEIEAAEEAEHLADLGTLRLSQPNGERELRARIEHELGASTVRARRREEEHTRLSHVSTAVQFACVIVRGVGMRPDTYEERPFLERTRPFLSRLRQR